ncbi:hypothetical protein HMPREF1112_1141 [Streptococcus pseudopneumoniae SK674]|nr:hypothetical protein HMPREF1112_1141 [Streptococcus pseudopneumoniae SK674]
MAVFKKQSISPHKHNILLLFEKVNSLCLFLLFIFLIFYKTSISNPNSST